MQISMNFWMSVGGIAFIVAGAAFLLGGIVKAFAVLFIRSPKPLANTLPNTVAPPPVVKSTRTGRALPPTPSGPSIQDIEREYEARRRREWRGMLYAVVIGTALIGIGYLLLDNINTV
jgi:hypothetical protein